VESVREAKTMNKAGQISQTTIEIIIVIAIVIVVNILGQFFYARADLTEDKQFTLAPSSKEVVAELPDLVHIKAYVSTELPPILQQQEQRLRDLMEEYRASASSRLTIQYIDPADMEEEERNNLAMKGLEETPVQITEADQLSYINVYMGLEISYLGGYEVIPFVPSVQNLEYEITSSVLKLISEDTPTIGFLTGHGEMSSQSGMAALGEALKELYNVQDVDISNGQHISEAINTLIIAQPAQPVTERDRYVIDQFVMRGGKLVVMGSGTKMDQMGEQATFQPFPLESLLSEYGVKINGDLIADLAYNWQVPGGSMGGFRVMVNYPLFPVISPPDGFPSDSAVTRGLDSLILPYVSSLDLLYDNISDDTEVLELAKTSVGSYSYPVPVDLSPRQEFQPPGGESDLKKHLVAVQLNGVFSSAFEGRAIPAIEPGSEGGMAVMDDEPMITASMLTTIVVIGNASFVDDQAIQAPGNLIFIENLMETLNIGEQLIDIRTRTVTNRPLNPDLTAGEKNAYRFWGYIFMPILITVLGMGRFYLKNQRKKLMAAIYQAEELKKVG